MHKTKIVATIGPACDSEAMIERLLTDGVNVFRFNMKHGTVAWHNERIERVESISQRLGMPVGILIDLQGPEIRIETLDQKPLPVAKGEKILLAENFVDGVKTIRVPDPKVIAALDKGDEILIDDGFLEFDAVEKDAQGIWLVAREDYQVSHRKGMNLPGVKLDLASLIDADLEKLDMAAKQHVDFVALSFVRDAKDIRILREEMQKRGVQAHVVAKIENASSLEHLDEILEATDAVMIARGDLGIEIPYEELTYWQKTLIHRCRQMGKSVITATQMLQSMIDSPRPTRAEVSDVANAVFDGSDAVMLSGETAQGKYPSHAVRAMRRIIAFNESKVVLPPLQESHALNQTESVTRAVLAILEGERDYDISAIVVFSETGNTVRQLVRHRPGLPILAVTEESRVRDQLCLAYGVMPVVMDFPEGEIHSLDTIMNELKTRNLAKPGDRLLFIHGNRWREPGLTNTISIKEVAA